MIKTILLADDSITMQKVIRLTFASGGYEITTADNGDEAIRKAEETRPHLVLVDAALPGRNGYEVCEAIKTNPLLKNTPVIILAGTFNPLDEGLAKKVGADDSIVKPFESKVLIEKVEALFRIYPPSERPVEEKSSAGAKGQSISGWAEDDIIRAPEPGEERAESGQEGLGAGVAPPEPGHTTAEFGDLITGPSETAQAPGEQAEEERPAAEGGGSVPTMETPHGESEGEDGFDIEGFEINPFKSGPLREENQPGEEESDVLGGQWSIDEEDVIGFENINAEEEIRSAGAGEEQKEEAPAEEAAVETPAETEEVPTLREPEESEEEAIPTLGGPGEEAEEEAQAPEETGAAAEQAEQEEAPLETAEGPWTEEESAPPPEEPSEAGETAPLAEEETSAEEAAASGEGAADEPLPDEEACPEEAAPSEEEIRELIKKTTVEVIEEVVRDTVPELLRKAMEEELDRIKEAIRKV